MLVSASFQRSNSCFAVLPGFPARFPCSVVLSAVVLCVLAAPTVPCGTVAARVLVSCCDLYPFPIVKGVGVDHIQKGFGFHVKLWVFGGFIPCSTALRLACGRGRVRIAFNTGQILRLGGAVGRLVVHLLPNVQNSAFLGHCVRIAIEYAPRLAAEKDSIRICAAAVCRLAENLNKRVYDLQALLWICYDGIQKHAYTVFFNPVLSV